MYKTIIMPVDVFEMELSDKAVRHAEFLAQDDGVIHLLHVLPGSASLSLHRLFRCSLMSWNRECKHRHLRFFSKSLKVCFREEQLC